MPELQIAGEPGMRHAGSLESHAPSPGLMQILEGLPALPLGQLAANPVHAAHVSALPMWSVAFPNSTVTGGTGRLSLHNSTLVLPASDYAVLLAAAQQGWQPTAVNSNASGAVHPVLALVDGFEVNTVAGLPEVGQPLRLLLLNLTGLGINARHITVLPDAPVPKGSALPRVVPPVEKPRGSGKSGPQAAIAVGASVGGGFALLLGAAAVFVYRAR